jgi:G3E family GTPase
MIPFTVIGGFLGAGKTTLLNRVLSDETDHRYLVMVNDFGELAVDDRLIKEHGGDTMTFANGCVCCTMGDNFLATLMDLLKQPGTFDHILVETSGVADPRPVADIAVLHPKLHRDLVVVLLDSETIRERADDVRLKETVDRQIEAADLLVLNRADRVNPEDMAAVKNWLAARKPGVPIVETVQADMPLDLLFGGVEARQNKQPAAHHHDHNQQFRATVVAFDNAIDPVILADRLKSMPSVLRAKGMLTTPDGPKILQLSGMEGTWQPATVADNRLVVIGTMDMMADEDISQKLKTAEIN